MSSFKRNSKLVAEKHSPRHEERNEQAPMSRLFVTNVKQLSQEEIMNLFKDFGPIAYVRIITDRNSHESKGIAYIKFIKTSHAAFALEEMNGKCVGDNNKPIRVYVASDKNEGSARHGLEKFVRLFVVVTKDTTEADLIEEFGKYGELDAVSIIRDKQTKENKRCAFVSYFKFSDAAKAFENCGQKFKAIFAEPKPSSNHDNNDRDNRKRSTMNDPGRDKTRKRRSADTEECQLNIICSNNVNQDQLWRLCDIVPGFKYCQLINEGSSTNSHLAVFNDQEAANYAKEKLHGFEYPPGNRVIAKMYDDPTLAFGNDRMKPSKRARGEDINSSVVLPKTEPMASSDSEVAMRCFVICSPNVLPQSDLRNIFCRFGNLIDVYMLNNKKYGYAKYATIESAYNAIDGLSDSIINGVTLKVMEAEEKSNTK